VSLSAFIAFASLAPLSAQIPELPPLKRIFGVGDNEFFKGAWMKVRPDSAGAPDNSVVDHAGQVWDLADMLGIDILRIQGGDFGNFDLTKAIIAQRRRTDQRLIISHVGTDFHKVSVARDIRLYPFTGRDSVEYAFWPVKFMTLAGGVTATNPVERDVYGQRAEEQHYRRGSLGANTVIARDIVFDQFPARQYRWPVESNGFVHRADSVQDTEEFLANIWQFNTAATNQFVVITGHLFDMPGRTLPGDTILKVEVIYEVPRGQSWYGYNGRLVRFPAHIDLELNLATLYVLRSDLSPAGSKTTDWNAYREVALRFDAAWCSDSTQGFRNTGPLYPGNPSRRINLKVTWTGSDDVAIRSIGLRDSLGQLVLGNSGIDTAGKAALLAGALRDARRGVTLTEDGSGPAQWPIIARSATIESRPMHSAAFNLLTKLVQDSIQAFDSINGVTDSIPVWNEVNTNYALFQRWKQDANPGLAVPDAVVTETGVGPTEWLGGRLGLINSRIPSIALHNGGRFGIPLLDLDDPATRSFAIEYEYESTLQLLGFHQYVPYRLDHDMEHYLHFELGRAAEVARDLRRRLIIVPFCVARISVNYIEGGPDEGPRRDTISALHLPEPAELRTMMNLGLCYGAKGVLWQVIEAPYNFMTDDTYATDSLGRFLYSHLDDFGVHSPLVRGPNPDFFPTFKFYKSAGRNGYVDTNAQGIAHNFFTGWRIRSAALTDIHRWIDVVGPELMKLDWRDGYSMHFTVEQPYEATLPFRPLPSTEIVGSIHARKPGATAVDSPDRTFVELGLFFTKNGTADPMLDTNHIFLVNRRCFERTADILESALGATMDALAETRTIEVRLQMPHPDTGGARLVRVRELGCDTTRLPLSSAPRTPLDTIVGSDSTFAITLGPGRAALLEITYLPRPRRSRSKTANFRVEESFHAMAGESERRNASSGGGQPYILGPDTDRLLFTPDRETPGDRFIRSQFLSFLHSRSP
jgi:hypothetical protein